MNAKKKHLKVVSVVKKAWHSETLKHTRFSKINLLVFALIFAAIGGYILIRIFAVGPTLKPPIQGLLDRDTKPATSPFDYKTVVRNFVIQVHWTDIEPCLPASLPSSPTDTNPSDSSSGCDHVDSKGQETNPNHNVFDFSSIDNLITYANNNGLKVRLRVLGGIWEPDSLKTLDGAPIPVHDSVFGGASGTIGRFWLPDYSSYYDDFQAELARKYDALSSPVLENQITRCTTIYGEPFQRDLGDAFTVQNLIDNGYSAQLDDVCQHEQIDSARHWVHTRAYLPFNPYQHLNGQNMNGDYTGSTDELYTEKMIDYCRSALGPSCVLGNNSVSYTATNPPVRKAALMYAYIAAKGPPIGFQSQATVGMTDLLGSLDWVDVTEHANSFELSDGSASKCTKPDGSPNPPYNQSYLCFTLAQLQPKADALVDNPIDNLLPTVSINASPLVVASGQSSTLTWSSTNADSCTASGAWNGNKALSGSQPTGPLTTTSTYNLACSSSSQTSSDSVTVTVNPPDTIPPTVSMTAPASGANVSGNALTVSASASDAGSGVANVEFQRSPAGANTWTNILIDTTSPYAATWDTTAVADGLYDLRAIAQDNSGNNRTSVLVTNVRVDNTNPTGPLTAPAASSNLRATVAVSANSADGGSGVANVKFQRSPAGAGTWTNIATDSSSPYTTNWDTTGVTDGLYDLRAVTTDNSGNTFNSPTISNVRVDNTAPAGSITAPAASANLRGSSVTFSASASDAGSGVANVQFQRSPAGAGVWTAISTDSSTPYSATLDTTAVADGLYDLRTITTDNAGNTTTATLVTVRVDNTNPSGSVTAPLASANVRGASVPVSANSADTGSGVASAQFQRSPSGANTWTTISTDTTSPYSVNWDTTALADGLYDLRITTTDNAGNTATSALVTVRVDNTAPTGSVTAPAGGAQVKSSITLSANGADGGSGLATIQFKVDGVNVGTAGSTSPYSISWDSSTATNGNHNITAVATDRAGNSTTSSAVAITVDNAAPTVSVTAPAVGSSVRGSSISVSANASDTGTGVAGVQFKIDGVNQGAEDTSSPYSVTWNTTLFTDGSHVITAVARDVVGNTATSASVSVTVDNTLPAGSITAPSASANVNGSAVSISSNSSDAGSGVASAQFQRSPAGANTWTTINTDSSSPYAVNWDTTPLADGLYDLRVITTDNAGNTFTSSLVNNVRVDNTRPTVSMTAPTNNSYLRGASVTISANANDGGSGLAGVQFKLDGVANIGSEDTSSPYSITWSTVGITNGPHTLSAVARDSAGNTQTSTTISVTVDNQAPTVSVTAPLSGVTVSGSSVAISANASDNTSVAGVQFMLDCPGPACGSLGPEDTSSPYTYTWDTTSLANGPHTLSALARDVAGNTNTSSLVTVNVDNTTPPPTDTEEPSIPTGLHSTAKSISTISLAWDASTDNTGGSGVAGYKIYRDGNFVTSTTLLNYTDTGLDAGTTYDYTVSAYDYASNKSPESPAVSVATDSILAPTVSLSAAPDTINSGDSSTLSWDSTDATDCVASGGWSGDKATSGSEPTGALTAGQTYTLTCSGAGGIAQASVSVTVKDAPPPPPPPSFKTGDLNRDGHVDIFDLSILLTHYGSYGTPNQGDINQNQVIDIYDLSLLLTNYGK